MASAVFGEFAKATPELIEGGLKSATLSKCTRF
jgi:hypothetical protein